MLTEFQSRGPEQKRISGQPAVRRGELAQGAARAGTRRSLDKTFFASKVAAEQELRSEGRRGPAKLKQYGAAWDEIARAEDAATAASASRATAAWSGARASRSSYFSHARTLVRAAEELPKPNEQRLREYGDVQPARASRQQLLQPRAHLRRSSRSRR